MVALASIDTGTHDRVVVAARPGETTDRLVDALGAEEVQAVPTETVRETLLEFDSDGVSAVLAEATLLSEDGVDLLEQVRMKHPETMTVLLCDPDDATPLNEAQEAGVDHALALDPENPSQVAELVRGWLTTRDLDVDRQRERALSGALLAGLSTIAAADDPETALSLLPKRLTDTGTVSVAWTSRYNEKSRTFEAIAAAGIHLASLRAISAETIDLDPDDPVRIDDDDPRRVTVLIRPDDTVFGAVHLYVERPGLSGPERRLLASAGQALGRVLASPRSVSERELEPGRGPTATDLEARGAVICKDGEPGPDGRPAVEVYGEVLAHELRNHLEVAQSYLRLGATIEGNEDLERVEAALSRIEAVIAEAEAVAGRSVSESDRVSVDIGATAEQIWGQIDTDAAELVVSNPGTVQAHHGMVDLLLENLFRNAVTHAGPDVEVTVGAFEDGFYVEDNGPGIPAADRDMVFEWGFPVGADRDGVGLAIVRRIAEAHGWSVEVTESSTGGARFEFGNVESG